MLAMAGKTHDGATLRSDVSAYLYDAFSAENSALAFLDRWTQRRVFDENMAKIALVLEADDPVEYCYQNLVREIDTEAETGIYLVGKKSNSAELNALTADPGISGLLHQEMATIAPMFFADELSHSYRDMDIVWVTIQARYDRAKIDATVSQMIMAHLHEDTNAVADMSDALRSLLYAFHEDLARRLSGMSPMLNERSMRELIMMVSDLADRAGDYGPRVEAICRRAGTS